ncbi:uncharacterized protein LOC143264379 [Megachile rotundata]|uniref:uncharacterized protein LOC143264379 n=1 Tax=Megachile rotundata TaxID=143995 RepID=UPI003FD5138D
MRLHCYEQARQWTDITSHGREEQKWRKKRRTRVLEFLTISLDGLRLSIKSNVRDSVATIVVSTSYGNNEPQGNILLSANAGGRFVAFNVGAWLKDIGCSKC